MKDVLKSGSAFVGAFAVGLAVTVFFRLPETESVSLSPFADEEIAMVLLVSPSCSASRDSQLPVVWRELLDAAKQDSAVNNRTVSAIGVAMSASTRSGLEFLERFGPFNEIIVGRGAYNTGALRYMLSDFKGPAALPQVVVLRRHYATRNDGTKYVASETVSRRLWGLQDIIAAAKRPLLASR